MIYAIVIIFGAWVLTSFLDRIQYKAKLAAIPLRVHVNGIRGKSSIVRYIASILREHGYKTLAKTTGTAPRIIDFAGQEVSLIRRGRPNIFEQLLLMKYFIRLRPQAIVVECMAINPTYSEWLESMVMNSHVYILTNVRLDHQDQLGETLEEIAASLALSLPRHATVITGETNPRILDILQKQCEQRHSRLIRACSPEHSTNEAIDISDFTHAPIIDNIRVCLAFSALLNIPKEEAMQTMARTTPDPGHFQLRSFFINQSEIAWANLFAVNDKESFMEWVQLLTSVHTNFMPIIILNHRRDRIDRVPLFTDVIKELGVKHIVTFGDCESMVLKILSEDASILMMGNSSIYANISGKDILNRVVGHFGFQRILLIGAVNIHTRQAEHLLSFIDGQTGLSEEII
jgi:poly-gamma-glutamate synthase PgsB/CapB